jgi:hypothetical protein
MYQFNQLGNQKSKLLAVLQYHSYSSRFESSIQPLYMHRQIYITHILVLKS